jgi:hypothetical protein
MSLQRDLDIGPRRCLCRGRTICRTLKGASYRLRGRGIDSLPSIRTQNQADQKHQPVASPSSVATASDSSVADNLLVTSLKQT